MTLTLHLEMPERVAPGRPVPMSIRLTNGSDAAVDLYLRGRTDTFDILVRDARGAVVWRRLAGEIIPAIVRALQLAPGVSLTLRESWSQRDQAGTRVAPGWYQVSGELLTDGDPLRAPPKPLEIAAR